MQDIGVLGCKVEQNGLDLLRIARIGHATLSAKRTFGSLAVQLVTRFVMKSVFGTMMISLSFVQTHVLRPPNAHDLSVSASDVNSISQLDGPLHEQNQSCYEVRDNRLQPEANSQPESAAK